MARLKTQEDVELARIESGRAVALRRVEAELERARLIWNTIRWCVLGACGTVCVGLIAWAAVRITDKPAWVEVVLALLASNGGQSFIIWRLIVRLRRFAPPPAPRDAIQLMAEELVIVEESRRGEGPPGEPSGEEVPK